MSVYTGWKADKQQQHVYHSMHKAMRRKINKQDCRQRMGGFCYKCLDKQNIWFAATTPGGCTVWERVRPDLLGCLPQQVGAVNEEQRHTWKRVATSSRLEPQYAKAKK